VCYIADDALLTDFEPVVLRQHSLTALTVGCLEHGILADLIQQKDPDMIPAKPFADQLGHLGQQDVQVAH
jgi:hypothetical protein